MKPSPSLPDYNACLVNLANSMLVHFGAETHAPTLPLADRYLAADRKNVVVLLLDAMGTSILKKHFKADSFFLSHLAGSYSSVFPPTTVAATTSVTSGFYPNEHSWLGWDCYFPQLNKNVTIYRNIDQLQEVGSAFALQKEETPSEMTDIAHKERCTPFEDPRPAADYHVGFHFIPYESIVQQMIHAGAQAYFATPFVEPFPQTLEEIFARVSDLCARPEKKFIYAYWNEPDSTMHKTGTTSEDTHKVITDLQDKVESLVNGLSDTTFFITADHGHMDSINLCILDYPEIMDCLVRMPSIEPRALNLFIKEERKAEFPKLFEEAFGDKFWLLTKEEVLEKKLFGPGTEHPLFREMLGDFLAIAISDTSLFNTHLEARLMPGGHAGLSEEELRIPLIVVERD